MYSRLQVHDTRNENYMNSTFVQYYMSSNLNVKKINWLIKLIK